MANPALSVPADGDPECKLQEVLALASGSSTIVSTDVLALLDGIMASSGACQNNAGSMTTSVRSKAAPRPCPSMED
jgi:hypothetical protein